MLKLVAATFAVISGGLSVVLQVTPSSVPVVAAESCVTITVEFAEVIAVVFTVHTVSAPTPQENTPAGAAEHVTTEGLSAVPLAAHLVNVPYARPTTPAGMLPLTGPKYPSCTPPAANSTKLELP